MNEFSLSDAVSLYYKQVDIAHKLWTYLQVVAGAAATLALAAANKHEEGMLEGILLGFLIFATGNCILLYGVQSTVFETGAAIKQGWPEKSRWVKILPAFEAWRPWQPVVLHIVIDAVVLGLVVLLHGKVPIVLLQGKW